MKKRLVGLLLTFSICMTAAVPSLAYYDKDEDGHCDKCGSLAPVTKEVGCNCTEGNNSKPWSNDPFIKELLKGPSGKGELMYDLEHSKGPKPQQLPLDDLRVKDPMELMIQAEIARD